MSSASSRRASSWVRTRLLWGSWPGLDLGAGRAAHRRRRGGVLVAGAPVAEPARCCAGRKSADVGAGEVGHVVDQEHDRVAGRRGSGGPDGGGSRGARSAGVDAASAAAGEPRLPAAARVHARSATTAADSSRDGSHDTNETHEVNVYPRSTDPDLRAVRASCCSRAYDARRCRFRCVRHAWIEARRWPSRRLGARAVDN